MPQGFSLRGDDPCPRIYSLMISSFRFDPLRIFSQIDHWIGCMYAIMNTCQELQRVRATHSRRTSIHPRPSTLHTIPPMMLIWPLFENVGVMPPPIPMQVGIDVGELEDAAKQGKEAVAQLQARGGTQACPLGHSTNPCPLCCSAV